MDVNPLATSPHSQRHLGTLFPRWFAQVSFPEGVAAVELCEIGRRNECREQRRDELADETPGAGSRQGGCSPVWGVLEPVHKRSSSKISRRCASR